MKLTSFIRHLTSTSILVIALVTLGACQTPREKEFESVKVGMAKDQVLDAAGNPTVTRRWKGMDRWIYFYPAADTREVHFREGKAVYAGSAYQPPVSAAEQDRLNSESNIAESKRLVVLERETEQARDAYHYPKSNLDDEVKKVAPNWKPVQ